MSNDDSNDLVTKGFLRQEFKREFDDFGFKIFKYFDARFEQMDKRFERQDEKINSTLQAVDALAKKVEVYHHEFLARDATVDRHERWHQQTARHVGLKLEY